MVTLGSQSKSVFGPNASLNVYNASSAMLQATAENWTLRWQYRVLYEPVSNSNIALYGTGAFKGEFQTDVILTTDNNNAAGGFLNRIGLSNGDLLVTSASIQYKDSNTNQSSIIYGFACRWWKAEQQQRKDEFVRYSLYGELIGVPTENVAI